MIPGSLPRRYARALFDLAREEKTIDETGEGLLALIGSLRKSSGSLAVLADRSYGVAERTAVVAEIGEKLKLSVTLTRFLSFVVGKERAFLLEEIGREYGRFRDEALGIVRVTVTTPEGPEAPMLKRVEQLLAGKGKQKVIAKGASDPEMIGGLILEIDHTVYDGSVRRELSRFREKMMKEEL